MKRKIFFTLFIVACAMIVMPGFSQQQTAAAPQTDKINWMDFEEAVALNQKKPRKIFIDTYTDWCGWCKKMDASTFVNPVIVKYMNEKYYAVKFNAERKDTVVFNGRNYVNPNPGGSRSSHQLAQELLSGRMSFPSFVILDEKLTKLQIIPGYKDAPIFEAILHFIGDDAYKTQTWEEFSSGFKTSAAQ